jgi:O-Antigen ligase
VSAHAAAAEQPTARLMREHVSAPPPIVAPQRRGATTAATLAIAGVLCLTTFLAGGGLRLAPMTTLELALTLAAGALVAGVVVLAPVGIRLRGMSSVGLLLVFTALTGLSVVWSVAPDASWQDAGRMLAYSGVLAAAVTLAWIAPGGWRALLGGIVLAATVVCGYALLTKVLPDRLDANDISARLQEPYGYWNAIGLTAAMGAIGCLWLGARRAGHAVLSALAYPAMGLMIVTLMLAYSRGALAALAVGVLAWMCLVPLRLRGARVLIIGTLGAAPVVVWDFSRHALSSDGIDLAARTTAGHQLGVLLAAMLLGLTLAGVAIGFFGDRRAPSTGARRAAGIALAALLVLAVVALAGGLASSRRGLTGTVSHDLSALTDPNAAVPKNTPGRLTAVGSVRARYWDEALKVFTAHPTLGAGGAGYGTARLRYRTQPLDVDQAHGYVVQTLADLGIVGLALTLTLLVAWMAAAGAPTHPFNRRWRARRSPPAIAWERASLAYTPERVGMLTMLSIVVVFGVHSFVDWTWYVPGDACVALMCAGWLAGRGSLPIGDPATPAGTPASAVPTQASVPAPAYSLDSGAQAAPTGDNGAQSRTLRRGTQSPTVDAATPGRARLPTAGELGPLRVGVAIAVVAGALLAAWTEWQPQRSIDASEHALVLLQRNPVAARAAAQAGVDRDPLSAVALFRLSAVQHATGESALARATLQKAVRLQPSNPETWLTLGEYDLASNPRAAIGELRAAVYLNPESIPAQNAYIRALRAVPQASSQTRAPAQKRPRRPLASNTRRAPGRPPAPATVTSSKPKSASSSASARRA